MSLESVFFDSWTGPLRVGVVAVLAYPALVLALRLSGKRTLAKMNAFDLVVTVALGSTLATILLSPDVTLAEGLAALVLLVALQYATAWLTVRTRLARSLAKAEPTLLLRDGEILEDVAKQQRVTAGEIRQAIRAQGHGVVEQIAAVVLETDGSFSVIAGAQAGSLTALDDLSRPDRGS